MESDSQSQPLPRHVAIIMDGNGRWAEERKLDRSEGHREGAVAVRRVVTRARERGIEVLTLFAFSAQNWKRPDGEVGRLMLLLETFCAQEEALLQRHEISFTVVGDRQRLPPETRRAVERLEQVTSQNQAMSLVVALSYGGREEITRAARRIVQDVVDGRLALDNVDSAAIEDRLWTAGLPDPDLVIRTSGELRVSNFLLWQIAYSEFVVDDRYWPEMDADAFDQALAAFAKRRRRFGGV